MVEDKLEERTRSKWGKQQAISSQSWPPYLFPSIYGNHWIIYKPLPLALCESVCEREGGFAELTTTMLCPAAVSAAAAAVWLLAVLGPGLSLPAEDNSDPGFILCSHCFYRQMPPQGAPAGPPLSPQCHRLPGGQAFATLSKPTCDTAVYSAFHLSHGWTEGGEEAAEEEGQLVVSYYALLFVFEWWVQCSGSQYSTFTQVLYFSFCVTLYLLYCTFLFYCIYLTDIVTFQKILL